MAKAGPIKAKIDLLKKKITDKGATASPERRRQLAKRLRRLQRARRKADTAEKKRTEQGKSKSKHAKEEAAAPAAPAQG
jgi:hypothetical protein